MDNPFGSNLNTTNEIFKQQNITLFSEKRGRKTNSYISGWEIDEEEMKMHLKNLKKKFACNGSVKSIEMDGNMQTVIHIQGDHIDHLVKYLIENDISQENINIK